MKHQTHPKPSTGHRASEPAPDRRATEQQAKLQAAGIEARATESAPTFGFSARYIDSRLKQFCLR